MNGRAPTDPGSFLEEQNRKLESLHKKRAESSWMAATTGEERWVKESADAQAAVKLHYADPGLFETIKDYRDRPIQDPIQIRQLDDLYRNAVANQVPRDILREMVRLSTKLVNTFNRHRALIDGKPVSDNHIRKILTECDVSDERENAWHASKQIGTKVSEELLALIRIRNESARSLGYRNHHQMSYELGELDRDAVFEIVHELKRRSDEPFAALKNEIDEDLSQRLNISPHAMRPWHYTDPFFQEAPPSAELDLDRFYYGADLESLTVETFDCVGMDIGKILSNSDLYPREKKNQHAFCSDIDRKGDIRVLCNNVPSSHWMMVMLHEFGHAVYNDSIDPDLPFMLRRPAHTLTTEAVAMLFGRLNKNPDWLKRIAGVEEKEVDNLAPKIHRTLRKQMLVSIRWFMTMILFERELYEDPAQDLNRLWWKIVMETQMMNPPDDQDHPHWAAKIHFTLAPVYYQNYLLGELTASQLHGFIHEKVSRDFLSKDIGEYLKTEFLAPGARLHWNEKIRTATGENLNPSHFIHQFLT